MGAAQKVELLKWAAVHFVAIMLRQLLLWDFCRNRAGNVCLGNSLSGLTNDYLCSLSVFQGSSIVYNTSSQVSYLSRRTNSALLSILPCFPKCSTWKWSVWAIMPKNLLANHWANSVSVQRMPGVQCLRPQHAMDLHLNPAIIGAMDLHLNAAITSASLQTSVTVISKRSLTIISQNTFHISVQNVFPWQIVAAFVVSFFLIHFSCPLEHRLPIVNCYECAAKCKLFYHILFHILSNFLLVIWIM